MPRPSQRKARTGHPVFRILSRGKLQRTHRRGSHRHDSPSGIARALDSLRRIRRNFVPLAMQLVLLHNLFAHRLKRAEADVQRDLGRLDSALAYALKNLRRKAVSYTHLTLPTKR